MRVFVGYDSREDIAYKVCKYSILKHSPYSVVIPVIQDELRAKNIYNRDPDLLSSTAFSVTRFLTPYLASYYELAVFCDCDFLFTRDIDTIIDELSYKDFEDKALWVVQHEYTPKGKSKMDQQKQIAYPRKNWCSFMLFDCHDNLTKKLTPELINKVDIPYLNELKWAEDKIGKLNPKWNFLVGEYEAPDLGAEVLKESTPNTPFGLHYTRGGVWLGNDYCPSYDYAELWLQYKAEYEQSLKVQKK